MSSYDAPKHHAQPFEQIIATIFTCRSIVKYNLTLSEAQKNELLEDIDSALEVLRTHLITQPEAKVEPNAAPQAQNSGMLIPLPDIDEASAQYGESDAEPTLQALYRMYHVYLNSQQTTNIGTFVARFNDVMTTINDMQRLLETSYGSYEAFVQQASVEDPLQRIRVFIADIYYIFMEFVRLLSEVLQQNDVQLDTEELSSLRSERGVELLHPTRVPFDANLEGNTEAHYNFTQLAQAYNNHQRLDKMRGNFSSRIAEGTAFLEFLKESININTNKREEITIQINSLVKLLADMFRLLSEYERATTVLLRPYS